MTRGGGGHADDDDDDARQLRAQCVINHTQAGAGMVWGMCVRVLTHISQAFHKMEN